MDVDVQTDDADPLRAMNSAASSNTVNKKEGVILQFNSTASSHQLN